MAGTDDYEPPPAGRWAGVRAALTVLLVTSALGAPVGLLWLLLSPRVPGLITDEGVILAVPETKAFIAGDAVFLILGIVVGTLCGLLAWAFARRGGVRTVVALAFGGGIGSLLAEWIAEKLSRASFDRDVDAARVGDEVDRFLRLGARGVLVGWPVAALIAFLVLTWRGSEADLLEPVDDEDDLDVDEPAVENRVGSG